MLVNIGEVQKKLKDKIRILSSAEKGRDWVRDTMNDIVSKYNCSPDLIFKVLTGTIRIFELDEPYLFILVSEILGNPELYFTDKEIERLKAHKFSSGDLNLEFNAIRISDKQFTTVISAKKLIEWGKNSLIRYNEKTQRPRRYKTADGIEYFQVTLNQNAVNSIMDSYINGYYIPNTITLNVPETADIVYDDETNTLLIEDLDAFDILDGYHRYVALQRVCSANPNFDYTMELRILKFSEEEARQFIWQEDQKTKMAKIDSESMNQNNYGNKVAALLNTGILHDYEDFINRSHLSNYINRIYFEQNRKYAKSELLNIRNEILNGFENIINEKPELVDKKIDNTWLFIALICISCGGTKLVIINQVYAQYKSLNRQLNILPKDVKIAKDIYKEVV